MNEAIPPSGNGDEPRDELGLAAGPFGQAEPVLPERLKRGRGTHRRYFMWMRLSRLAFAAFIFMGIIVLLWLIPWLPAGLDTGDYTPRVAFTIYLLAGSAFVGLLVLSLQELARRDREILRAWTSVYDEATGLHTRAYFYDRLSLECERARTMAEPFSVIALQFRAPGAQVKKNKLPLSGAALEKIAQLINSVTHPTDLVGLLSGSELAVLTIGVDRERRHLLQERLEHTVATLLPEFTGRETRLDVRSGGSTYGVDGTEPGGLIQAARTSATLGVRQRAKVV